MSIRFIVLSVLACSFSAHAGETIYEHEQRLTKTHHLVMMHEEVNAIGPYCRYLISTKGKKPIAIVGSLNYKAIMFFGLTAESEYEVVFNEESITYTATSSGYIEAGGIGLDDLSSFQDDIELYEGLKPIDYSGENSFYLSEKASKVFKRCVSSL